METIILAFAMAPFILEQMAKTKFYPNSRVKNWVSIVNNILK